MIILINGNAPRCGKDTMANYIAKQYGFKHMKFATQLHEEVCKEFGLERPADDAKDSTSYEWLGGVTYRQLLIVYGETIKRLYDNKYFAYKLIDKIDCCDDDVVVSDLGFEYEIPPFRKLDHKIVVVHTYMDTQHKLVGDSRKNLKYLADYVISNNGTLEQYYEKIDNMMVDLCLRRIYA